MKKIFTILLLLATSCQHARWVSKQYAPGSIEHLGGIIRYGHLDAAFKTAMDWCAPRQASILKDAIYYGTPTTVYIGYVPVTDKHSFKYIEFVCVDKVEATK